VVNVFKLTKHQWGILCSALSNISQGIILFSLAAIFVPQTVGLSIDFSRNDAQNYLIAGLCSLMITVILSKKGK